MRKRIVVLASERDIRSSIDRHSRLRVSAAASGAALARVTHRRGRRISMIVLDTSIRPAAGGLDASDVALFLNSDLHSGGAAYPALLWTDRSIDSVHLAEEVSEYFQDWRMGHLLLGACCHRLLCLEAALRLTAEGRPWRDEHLPNLIGQHSNLFAELRRDSSLTDVLMASFAEPCSWAELAEALEQDYERLLGSIDGEIAPALRRLGWLNPEDELTTGALIDLASHRRRYLVRYITRYRPDLTRRYTA